MDLILSWMRGEAENLALEEGENHWGQSRDEVKSENGYFTGMFADLSNMDSLGK